MAVIIVRCPKTREDILPGIEITEADFRAVPLTVSGVRCPRCGEQHSWLPYAARMAEALTASIDKAPSVVPCLDETTPQPAHSRDDGER